MAPSHETRSASVFPVRPHSRASVGCSSSHANAAAIAAALAWLLEHPMDAREWGRTGKTLAERVSWDGAIDRLLEAGSRER